jgi:RNA polymerase sigma-70 factor (ECF subfamily)
VTREEEQRAAGLMKRAQRGDAIAYAELLTMLTAAARRFARHRLGDSPAVEDVTQETLISVHTGRRFYDPRRPFAPWFFAILSRRVIDAVRRERRLLQREVAPRRMPEVAAAAEPLDEGIRRGDADRLHAALATLPARQREIIHSLKFREESVRDIAARMGMSPSAVKVAAHRAYRLLRRRLGERR